MKKISQSQNAWLWVIFVLLAVNVLTTELYTSVWLDEVLFSMPAANQYFGLGFTSTAWPFQGKEAFWAGNVPLHTLLLCAWYKLFGFGIHQTRIFGYVLWSLADCFLCLAARRFGWVTTPKGLSLLAALAFLGNGVTFAFRSSRYEPLAVLLATLCLLAFSIPSALWRNVAILLVSTLFLPACLALGPFYVVMAAVLLAVTRWKFLRELAMAGTGLAIGFGLLYLLYHHFGVWHDFTGALKKDEQAYHNPVVYIHVFTNWGTIPFRKGADFVRALASDNSSLILALATGILFAFRGKDPPLWHPRLFTFSFIAFLAVPIGLLLFYAFPIYYWWMRYLPLCLAFAALVESRRVPAGGRAFKIFVACTILIVSLSGLPGRLLLASLDLRERDYSRVENFVRGAVKPGDVVVADYQAFYPLEKLKVRTYYRLYLHHMTPEEATSVNCLIIDPQIFNGTRQKLGGTWRNTGQEDLNDQHFGVKILDRLMPHYFLQQSNHKYNLAVYRKIPSPSTTQTNQPSATP